jgi:hypothetical protein
LLVKQFAYLLLAAGPLFFNRHWGYFREPALVRLCHEYLLPVKAAALPLYLLSVEQLDVELPFLPALLVGSDYLAHVSTDLLFRPVLLPLGLRPTLKVLVVIQELRRAVRLFLILH